MILQKVVVALVLGCLIVEINAGRSPEEEEQRRQRKLERALRRQQRKQEWWLKRLGYEVPSTAYPQPVAPILPVTQPSPTQYDPTWGYPQPPQTDDSSSWLPPGVERKPAAAQVDDGKRKLGPLTVDLSGLPIIRGIVDKFTPKTAAPIVATTPVPPVTRPENLPPYSLYPRICGLSRNTRIVGGQEADPKAWLWMAALIKKSGDLYCGGALITERHILTAAHCLRGQTPMDMFVRLGSYDFSQGADPESVDYQVQAFRIHPGYDKFTQKNDIAILVLDRKATFTDHVSPICLPPNHTRRTYEGTIGTVVGWGAINYGGPSSDKLREVSLPIWNETECVSAYSSKVITERNLCAGYKDGKRDSCSGDSGGPLMIQGPAKRWMVVGVVSWGIRCGEPNSPGVYSRVTEYVDWIKANVV